MKKLLFNVGIMLVFGVCISFFSINVSAMEKTEESSKELDPIVAQDGPEDGINDQSSVNIKITKISDDVTLGNLISTRSAGWDYIGYSAFYSQSKTFYSSGGNLRILIAQPYTGPSTTWLYKLIEEDPTIDDTVKTFELPNSSGTYTVDFSVGSFVDGDNGKAELHLSKLTVPTSSVATEWYD
ncbi:hypothetical protein [Peribacillus frigoritolerans]|uniref:hypothetical protein n=1 Tax=Peribacillus frigoritolerans TaxID=450367 RepID=UPI0007BFA757|nr:hypothetical protein [Listeria monocytogenes]